MNLVVEPFDDGTSTISYHILVATVGFEERARFVASDLSPRSERRVAIGFTQGHALHYAENRAWFTRHDFEVHEPTDAEYGALFRRILEEATVVPTAALRVAIDVSSLSRIRIATVIDLLRSTRWNCEVVADFYYAPAIFTEPVEEDQPNVHVGPVLPEFAGWTTEPEYPSVSIVGLGYEEDRALGAVEHTQSGEVWAFLPRSMIPGYEQALQTANATLLEGIRQDHVFNYQVEQPFDCFVALEALAYGAMQHANTVLFPFGPKVFAVCCLLVACIHEQLAVWRVSAGGDAEPVDRVANGQIVGISLRVIRADLVAPRADISGSPAVLLIQ
jgi:hypothetical protein